MLIFWIIVALFIGLALVFVATPLLRKNAPALTEAQSEQNALNIAIYKERLADLKSEKLSPEEYAQAKIALDKSLLQELSENALENKAEAIQGRWAGFLVLLLVPALAISLYLWQGSPELLNPNHAQAIQNTGEMPVDLEEAVKNLAARLKENPNDLMGWHMLARSYVVLERYSDAATAYKSALSAGGDQVPDILAEYAETLAALNGNQFAGESTILLDTALKLEPSHQKTLWLLGIAATQKKDYNRAVGYWQQLLAQFPLEDVQARELLQSHIADAQELAKTSETESPSEIVKTKQIQVTVHLSPTLQNHIKSGDVVFVYAVTQESKKPLMAIKKPASELPFTVILDEGVAITNSVKLSDFQEVTVFASVSHNDSPMLQTGDLQGKIVVAIEDKPLNVEIVIDQIIP